MKGVTLPLAQVAGVRGVIGTGKGPGILNLALIAHPNIMLDLLPPLERHGRAMTASRTGWMILRLSSPRLRS